MPGTFTPPAPEDIVNERFVPPSPVDVVRRFTPPLPDDIVQASGGEQLSYGPPTSTRLPSDPYAGAAEEMVRPVTAALPAVTEDAARAMALMKYAEDTQPGRWKKQPETLKEWVQFTVGGMLSPIKQAETATEAALIAIGIGKPGDRLLYRPSEALEKKYAGPLPRVPQQEGNQFTGKVAAQVAGGLANTVIDFADFLQTPEGTLSLGLGKVPKEVQKVILGFFSTKLAIEAPEQFNKAYEAAKAGNVQEAVQHATGGAGGVFLSGLMAKHVAFGDAPKFAEPNESPIPITDAAAKANIAAVNLMAPSRTPRPNEQQAWVPILEGRQPPEGSFLTEMSWKELYPKEVDLGTSPKLQELKQAILNARQRQQEMSEGKLEAGEPPRSVGDKSGFEVSAEEKLVQRSDPTPTRPLPERESGTPLKDVEQFLRERLEQRDWAGVVNALAEEPAHISRKMLDKLLGVGEEAVPLSAGERTIFNEIWDREVAKSSGSRIETWADETIAKSQGRLFTGIDPELLAAYVVKGAIFIGRGAKRFVEWSQEMIREYGEGIRPYLNETWDKSRLYHEDVKSGGHSAVEVTDRRRVKGPVLQPPAPTPEAVSSESGLRSAPVTAGELPPPRAELPLEEAQVRPTQAVTTADAETQAGTPKILIDPYSTPMLERLASLGGPVSKQVAKEARAIDADTVTILGSVSDVVDKARQLAGKAFRGGTTWIRGKDNVTPNAAIARLHTLEGTDRAAVVAMAPPKAQEMVGAIWDANVPAIGGMAQRANVGFAPTGKIQRIPTSRGMDIILSGGGKLWDRLVEGTATANGKTVADTAAFFKEWKALLDDPSPDAAKIDQIAQDYVRQFPKAITHIKSAGQWIEVLVSDPVDYLKEASERTARAVAFRKVYPNTPAGRAFLMDTHKAVLAELPTSFRAEEFNNLMKSLQGHRLDTAPESYAAAIPGAQGVMETVSAITRPLKSAMLSVSSLANAAESVIGGPHIFLGYRNTVAAFARNPLRFYKQLEMAGLVDRSTRNFAFNPTAPLRSVSRMVSEGVSRLSLNNVLNELQEFQASGSSRVLADRVRAGDLTPGETKDFQSVLRAMGFRENFAAIAEGRDAQGLAEFERQAAPFFSAGHGRPAVSSRLANSRAFNSIAWFHRYPQMVVNQFRGIANNLLEDIQTKNGSHAYRDGKLMMKFLGGKVAQGVLMQLIVTGVKEGAAGVEQRTREAREAFGEFIKQMFVNAVGGPLTLATRIADKSGSGEEVAGEAIKMSAPVSTSIDLYNAIAGKGRYAGMGAFETAAQFLESKTPAIPAVRSAMGAIGLAEDNTKLRVAIGGFYRWARHEGYKFPAGHPKDAKFTKNMRQVVKGMERGETDWREKLRETLIAKADKREGDAQKSVMASLQQRKILKNEFGGPLKAAEIDSLRRWLGEDNIRLLRQRDAMVDALAESFKE